MTRSLQDLKSEIQQIQLKQYITREELDNTINNIISSFPHILSETQIEQIILKVLRETSLERYNQVQDIVNKHINDISVENMFQGLPELANSIIHTLFNTKLETLQQMITKQVESLFSQFKQEENKVWNDFKEELGNWQQDRLDNIEKESSEFQRQQTAWRYEFDTRVARIVEELTVKLNEMITNQVADHSNQIQGRIDNYLYTMEREINGVRNEIYEELKKMNEEVFTIDTQMKELKDELNTKLGIDVEIKKDLFGELDKINTEVLSLENHINELNAKIGVDEHMNAPTIIERLKRLSINDIGRHQNVSGEINTLKNRISREKADIEHRMNIMSRILNELNRTCVKKNEIDAIHEKLSDYEQAISTKVDMDNIDKITRTIALDNQRIVAHDKDIEAISRFLQLERDPSTQNLSFYVRH